MNSLELWMLFTWVDLIQILFFGFLLVMIYRRGRKDGIKEAEDERVMRWVRREFEKHNSE